jgi:hypothetical protein
VKIKIIISSRTVPRLRNMERFQLTGEARTNPRREGIDDLIKKYQFSREELAAIGMGFNHRVEYQGRDMRAFEAALLVLDEHYSRKGMEPYPTPQNSKDEEWNRALKNGIVALTVVMGTRGCQRSVNLLRHNSDGMESVMHVAMTETVALLGGRAWGGTLYAPLGALAASVMKYTKSGDSLNRSRAYVAKRFLTLRFMDGVSDPTF